MKKLANDWDIIAILLMASFIAMPVVGFILKLNTLYIFGFLLLIFIIAAFYSAYQNKRSIKVATFEFETDHLKTGDGMIISYSDIESVKIYSKEDYAPTTNQSVIWKPLVELLYKKENTLEKFIIPISYSGHAWYFSDVGQGVNSSILKGLLTYIPDKVDMKLKELFEGKTLKYEELEKYEGDNNIVPPQGEFSLKQNLP